MARGNERLDLSYEERRFAKENGVNAALAASLGASAESLKILTSRNAQDRTIDGVLGYMSVTVEWTDKEADKWHWHSLRFNGENPVSLSDEHLTILGGFACSRETIVRDFTRGPNNMPLTRREPQMAPIPELPLPEILPTLDQITSVEVAA